MAIKIAVLNESTCILDRDVTPVVNAFQIQLARDFAPAWGVGAEVTFYPGKAVPPPDSWQLVILDDSDQADALGYHEMTDSGMPLGKVFAASDIQAGTLWSVTLSHEGMEMLRDPYCNLVVEVDNPDGTMTLYADEVSDAVEADGLGYNILDPATNVMVRMSDFVMPAWFVPGSQGPWSFMRHAPAPFALAPGGYISIMRIPGSSGWEQVTANRKPGGPPAPRGSRRWRRTLPDIRWLRSRKVR